MKKIIANDSITIIKRHVFSLIFFITYKYKIIMSILVFTCTYVNAIMLLVNLLLYNSW